VSVKHHDLHPGLAAHPHSLCKNMDYGRWRDSLKTVFQNWNLKFTLYTCAVTPIKFKVIKQEKAVIWRKAHLRPAVKIFTFAPKFGRSCA
jgi:hypothetical protein